MAGSNDSVPNFGCSTIDTPSLGVDINIGGVEPGVLGEDVNEGAGVGLGEEPGVATGNTTSFGEFGVTKTTFLGCSTIGGVGNIGGS